MYGCIEEDHYTNTTPMNIMPIVTDNTLNEESNISTNHTQYSVPKFNIFPDFMGNTNINGDHKSLQNKPLHENSNTNSQLARPAPIKLKKPDPPRKINVITIPDIPVFVKAAPIKPQKPDPPRRINPIPIPIPHIFVKPVPIKPKKPDPPRRMNPITIPPIPDIFLITNKSITNINTSKKQKPCKPQPIANKTNIKRKRKKPPIDLKSLLGPPLKRRKYKKKKGSNNNKRNKNYKSPKFGEISDDIIKEYIGETHSSKETRVTFLKYLKEKQCIKVENGWKCMVGGKCGKTYGDKTHLKRHIDEIHIGRRYFCTFCNCGMKVRQRGSLKEHIRNTHFDVEKPWHCFLCGDVFSRWCGVRRHICLKRCKLLKKYKHFKIKKEKVDKIIYEVEHQLHRQEARGDGKEKKFILEKCPYLFDQY